MSNSAFTIGNVDLSAYLTIASASSTYAPIASPTFTGTVTLPASQIVNGVTLVNGGTSTLYLSQDGTYTTPPSGGAPAFSAITGATNTTAAMVVGTGASMSASGSGTIAATSVTNATLTTALTVNTGTVTITGNVANTSVLTIGAGAVSISGSNTGDQTTVSGNAGTATALQNARTIGGVSFDGTANITVSTATAGFTVSGGALALGTQNLTMTGSLAATGARVTKGWFTDIESTNTPTVGGTALPTASSTTTFTNKRITKRVLTTNAPGATPTLNTDNYDVANFTGLSAAITSMTTNLSGTPTAFQPLIIAFTDDGTAKGITWGASFESSTATLPTTTVISTLLTVGFFWNSVTSKWRCIAVA